MCVPCVCVSVVHVTTHSSTQCCALSWPGMAWPGGEGMEAGIEGCPLICLSFAFLLLRRLRRRLLFTWRMIDGPAASKGRRKEWQPDAKYEISLPRVVVAAAAAAGGNKLRLSREKIGRKNICTLNRN